MEQKRKTNDITHRLNDISSEDSFTPSETSEKYSDVGCVGGSGSEEQDSKQDKNKRGKRSRRRRTDRSVSGASLSSTTSSEGSRNSKSGPGRDSKSPTSPQEGRGSTSNSPCEGRGSKLNSPYEGRGSKLNSPYEGKGSKSNSPYEGRGSKSSSPYEGRGSKSNSPYEERGSKSSSPRERRESKASSPYERGEMKKVSEGIQTEEQDIENYIHDDDNDAVDDTEQVIIPKRHLLLLMIFLGFINIYAMRVSLNVAIVAMVNNKTVILRNGTVTKVFAEFQWDSKLQGCPVGNIIAIPITGMLAKYGFDGGWPSVFYCFGFFAIAWYALWEYLAADTPAHHPTISKAERAYIEASIGGHTFDPLKEKPPWKDILSSVPMWGIIIGHFGACWGYYTLFTQMPTYLKDIQHLDIKTMGFVAATPYILKSFIGPIGGISADILIRRKILTVKGVRVLFYGVGCCLAGGCILATGYCVEMEDAIAFLILGVGFSGLNATGYAVNHLDIAPRYAGILMGLSNTFATIPGFLSPMLTGMITREKRASEWKVVFWITFAVYIIATGLYSIMCSGELQPWGDPDTEQDSNQDPNLDSNQRSITSSSDGLNQRNTSN
eukprot:gene5562-6248_t